MTADPNAANAEPAAEREVVVQRVFDAPARLLFLAYAKPEHVRQWFGPRGWPLTTVEMDFRVGGAFRFGMTGPDGAKGPLFGGEYKEIVPNEKIVYDNGFFQPSGAKSPPDQTMLVTVTFVERGGKTTLTIHTLFGSKAMHKEHTGHGIVEGINSGLDQMEEWATRMQQQEAV